MPNFDRLLPSVVDKMDVSQDFTDSPRKNLIFFLPDLANGAAKCANATL